jgi:hypothetical protein
MAMRARAAGRIKGGQTRNMDGTVDLVAVAGTAISHVANREDFR